MKSNARVHPCPLPPGARTSPDAGDARGPLAEALTLADECDAPSQRADLIRQLAATGATTNARPRRANALHPRQRRVARLAAEGNSEAEIAYAMVLDLDTVTALLRGAHTTLGTTSRTELGPALA